MKRLPSSSLYKKIREKRFRGSKLGFLFLTIFGAFVLIGGTNSYMLPKTKLDDSFNIFELAYGTLGSCGVGNYCLHGSAPGLGTWSQPGSAFVIVNNTETQAYQAYCLDVNLGVSTGANYVNDGNFFISNGGSGRFYGNSWSGEEPGCYCKHSG